MLTSLTLLLYPHPKFVKYTQEHCRDATTTCDANAMGTFNYTDSEGHEIIGASEATRFYDTLV